MENISLLEIQKKIQNLRSDASNSKQLQLLLNNAGNIIGKFDSISREKILDFRDELNFYLKGGEDNLEKFYKCKAETLTIISKSLAKNM